MSKEINMKKSKIALFALLPIIAVLFVFCAGLGSQNDEVSQRKIITFGASEKLNTKLSGNITWRSSDENIVRVDQEGTITASGIGDLSIGRGSARITARADDQTEVFAVTVTLDGEADMLTLSPLKDDFSDYFLLGNIFNPNDVSTTRVTNERLIRHYNVLTAENNMKPDKLSPSRGSYDFSAADRMVNAAIGSGFKVVGHTLLWHSQIPEWQAALRNNNTSPEVTLQYMKDYITRIVTHYKGRIYSWDVINEAFPDGGYNSGSDWKNVMRKDNNGNPWYMKLGADFVYEGFLAARLADPGAILYYNDYNLDQTAKATMVRNMVRDVNARFKQEYPNETRLLIEGIGMQGHHNTGISAASIRNSINLFRPLGVIISISELDILSQRWGDYSPSRTPPTNSGKLWAANLYGEFFSVFLENSDIIERVTFWGVYDEQSWRRSGLPLLFEGNPTSRAKPSYYKVIEALNKHKP